MTREATDRVEQAYREHSQRLLRAVFAYARSREIAEDAVAEAFAQAIRRQGEIFDVGAWVWRSAFRIASRELGDRRRDSHPAPDTGYEMDERAALLIDALAQLSPKQRAAVLLHHYAGYRTKEIADAIGSTGGAVRVHLSVGRKRLRQALEERDG